VLPIAAAIGVAGLSFGALAVSVGLTPSAAIFMSATTFAGSAQFGSVSVLGAGGSVAAAVGAGALLAARYGPMGLAVAPALRGGALRRFLIAQLAVDESWAVAYLGEGRFDERRLIGAAVALLAVHVVATAFGAAAFAAASDRIESWGLDAAFPALFLVLLEPHLRACRGFAAAVLGGAVALFLVPVAPPGVPVLAAASAGLLGLRSR
jgi:predicted branched-subunit amino acid permease